MIRALVLNLASETDRMAFQTGQLDRLGIGYDRIEAVTPDKLDPPPEHAYWSGWQRPMRSTECAALATHAAAWQAVVADGEPRLILEDDAVLMPAVPPLLQQVVGLGGIDHLTLETRGRKKLIGSERHADAPIHRLWQDRTGAAAYILWPDGAARLLARAERAPALADAMICAAYDVRSWQAVPALACQLDRCAAEGFAPPLDTESAIDRERLPKERPSPAQRMRRVMAQARMGIRQLVRRPGSDRVMLSVRGS